MQVFQRIYAIVRRVPPGRVTTYGEVAILAGLRGGARTVGWALASLPENRTAPWWRVLRSDGTIANRRTAEGQRRRLLREGVRVDRRGGVDLDRYGWPSTRTAGIRTSRRPEVQVARAAIPQAAAHTRSAAWTPSHDASQPASRPPTGPVPKRARM